MDANVVPSLLLERMAASEQAVQGKQRPQLLISPSCFPPGLRHCCPVGLACLGEHASLDLISHPARPSVPAPLPALPACPRAAPARFLPILLPAACGVQTDRLGEEVLMMSDQVLTMTDEVQRRIEVGVWVGGWVGGGPR